MGALSYSRNPGPASGEVSLDIIAELACGHVLASPSDNLEAAWLPVFVLSYAKYLCNLQFDDKVHQEQLQSTYLFIILQYCK